MIRCRLERYGLRQEIVQALAQIGINEPSLARAPARLRQGEGLRFVLSGAKPRRVCLPGCVYPL